MVYSETIPNDYNDVNIIALIMPYCRSLTINGLHRVDIIKDRFKILNSKSQRFALSRLAHSDLFGRTIQAILVQVRALSLSLSAKVTILFSGTWGGTPYTTGTPRHSVYPPLQNNFKFENSRLFSLVTGVLVSP